MKREKRKDTKQFFSSDMNCNHSSCRCSFSECEENTVVRSNLVVVAARALEIKTEESHLILDGDTSSRNAICWVTARGPK